MSSPRSANSEVRIGILGSGWMGSVHAECYQRIEGAKVVGVFSRKRERAEVVAKMCGAKAVADVSALLDSPNIDAIDVCVPTANHAEFVLAALEHGKHVFCETPDAIRGKADPGLLDAKHASEALKLSLATLQSVKDNRLIRVAGETPARTPQNIRRSA
jgi:UDP-N-acetylglucosamine 3-dehydrogenase